MMMLRCQHGFADAYDVETNGPPAYQGGRNSARLVIRQSGISRPGAGSQPEGHGRSKATPDRQLRALLVSDLRSPKSFAPLLLLYREPWSKPRKIRGFMSLCINTINAKFCICNLPPISQAGRRGFESRLPLQENQPANTSSTLCSVYITRAASSCSTAPFLCSTETPV